MVEKYIKDGILYSPGFGAGWSTWGEQVMAYDADLVAAFLDGGSSKVEEVAEKKYPDAYLGGAHDLTLAWVTQGERYRINEYDGSESLEIIGPDSFMTA